MTPSRIIAAALLAAGTGAGAAHAIDFTYLEAGALWENTDENRDFSIGSLGSGGGAGARVAGGVDILFGVFVDGEFAWTNPDLDALLSVGGETASGSVDATSTKLRLSGGYKLELLDILAVYGQAGYVQRGFDADNLSLDVTGNNLSLFDLDDDQSGYEFEVGARAEVLPFLELTGAVRYSDVGSLTIPAGPEVSIPEVTTLSDVDFDDGVFGEVGFLFDIAGPLAVRGTYEIGDTDAAFLGLRAQF